MNYMGLKINFCRPVQGGPKLAHVLVHLNFIKY